MLELRMFVLQDETQAVKLNYIPKSTHIVHNDAR